MSNDEDYKAVLWLLSTYNCFFKNWNKVLCYGYNPLLCLLKCIDIETERTFVIHSDFTVLRFHQCLSLNLWRSTAFTSALFSSAKSLMLENEQNISALEKENKDFYETIKKEEKTISSSIGNSTVIGRHKATLSHGHYDSMEELNYKIELVLIQWTELNIKGYLHEGILSKPLGRYFRPSNNSESRENQWEDKYFDVKGRGVYEQLIVYQLQYITLLKALNEPPQVLFNANLRLMVFYMKGQLWTHIHTHLNKLWEEYQELTKEKYEKKTCSFIDNSRRAYDWTKRKNNTIESFSVINRASFYNQLLFQNKGSLKELMTMLFNLQESAIAFHSIYHKNQKLVYQIEKAKEAMTMFKSDRDSQSAEKEEKEENKSDGWKDLFLYLENWDLYYQTYRENLEANFTKNGLSPLQHLFTYVISAENSNTVTKRMYRVLKKSDIKNSLLKLSEESEDWKLLTNTMDTMYPNAKENHFISYTQLLEMTYQTKLFLVDVHKRNYATLCYLKGKYYISQYSSKEQRRFSDVMIKKSLKEGIAWLCQAKSVYQEIYTENDIRICDIYKDLGESLVLYKEMNATNTNTAHTAGAESGNIVQRQDEGTDNIMEYFLLYKKVLEDYYGKEGSLAVSLAYSHLASLLIIRHELTNAMIYLKESIIIYETIKKHKQWMEESMRGKKEATSSSCASSGVTPFHFNPALGILYFHLGRLYEYHKEYDKALETYVKLSRWYEALGNRSDEYTSTKYIYLKQCIKACNSGLEMAKRKRNKEEKSESRAAEGDMQKGEEVKTGEEIERGEIREDRTIAVKEKEETTELTARITVIRKRINGRYLLDY